MAPTGAELGDTGRRDRGWSDRDGHDSSGHERRPIPARCNVGGSGGMWDTPGTAQSQERHNGPSADGAARTSGMEMGRRRRYLAAAVGDHRVAPRVSGRSCLARPSAPVNVRRTIRRDGDDRAITRRPINRLGGGSRPSLKRRLGVTRSPVTTSAVRVRDRGTKPPICRPPALLVKTRATMPA